MHEVWDSGQICICPFMLWCVCIYSVWNKFMNTQIYSSCTIIYFAPIKIHNIHTCQRRVGCSFNDSRSSLIALFTLLTPLCMDWCYLYVCYTIQQTKWVRQYCHILIPAPLKAKAYKSDTKIWDFNLIFISMLSYPLTKHFLLSLCQWVLFSTSALFIL